MGDDQSTPITVCPNHHALPGVWVVGNYPAGVAKGNRGGNTDNAFIDTGLRHVAAVVAIAGCFVCECILVWKCRVGLELGPHIDVRSIHRLKKTKCQYKNGQYTSLPIY